MAKDVVIAAYGPVDESRRWLAPLVASLRSRAANLGRIVVVGDIGAIDDLEVERYFVPPLIARGSRYDNATEGVLRAIEAGMIGGRFLFAPPGAEIEENVDLDRYPVHTRCERIKSIADLIRENGGGAVVTRYRLVLADTRTALERNGYAARELTGRFLTHMDSACAPEVKRIWLQEPHGEFGYDVSCLFGNVAAGIDHSAETAKLPV